MFGWIFLGLGGVFFWLLFKGFTSGEIMARGWGTQIRIYQRDSEPFMFWFTSLLYLVLILVSWSMCALTFLKGR